MLGDRAPRAADAASLAYTTRVIKEALRLYPPVQGVGRRTGVAGVVGGYLLPAGSVVVVSPWVTHRHPRHWSDPDRLEAVIATAAVARDYRLATPPGPIPLATGITLRPAAGVPCMLTRSR